MSLLRSAPRCAPLLVALSALGATPNAAAGDAPASQREWSFRVTLDDKPIGEHRFTVARRGDEREVTSDARFAVKVLGFSVYRYVHRASEHWRGDCIAAIESDTDDDGKVASVHLERRSDPPAVAMSTDAHPLDGCVMSFAYWNPAMRTQTQLLNAQTGRLEPVRIERVGDGPIPVHGRPVAATQWRIVAPGHSIGVWYTSDGEWIGLDSVVNGGHKLSYRLP